jgi:hypothetical protein
MALVSLIIVFVVVVVVVGVVLAVVLTAVNSRKSAAPPTGFAPPPDQHPLAGGYGPYQAGAGPLSAPALAQVQALLVQGNMIQAIKVVREETRMGLKDAKDYVDAMAAGRPALGPWGVVPLAPQPGGAPLSERARAFRSAGDPASAVALVRAETGMSQSEAERFLDALN